MPRARRKFSDEYKAEILHLIRTSGQSVGQICRSHDLVESSVRRWMAKADEAEHNDDTTAADDKAELRRLRREVAQLRTERDFLKKAAAFFARESE